MLYPKLWRAKTAANIAESPEIILKQLHLCRKGWGSHNRERFSCSIFNRMNEKRATQKLWKISFCSQVYSSHSTVNMIRCLKKQQLALFQSQFPCVSSSCYLDFISTSGKLQGNRHFNSPINTYSTHGVQLQSQFSWDSLNLNEESTIGNRLDS